MATSTTRRSPRDLTFHLYGCLTHGHLHTRARYTFSRRQLTGCLVSDVLYRHGSLYDSPQAFVGLGPRAILTCLFMVFGVTSTFGEGWMVEVRATSYLRGLIGPAYVLSEVCH